MRFINPLGSVTCHFCFEKFHLSQAARRNDSLTAPKRHDAKVAEFLGLPVGVEYEMAKTEESETPARLRDVALRDMPLWLLRRGFIRNDRRTRARSVKICPHCHMQLPHHMASGDVTSEVIAIVGRNSGKSNYFGVLLKALEDLSSQGVFSLIEEDTFSIRERKPIGSWTLYNQRYGDRLFRSADRMAIPKTPSLTTQDGAEFRIPLIFRLDFPKSPRHTVTRPLSPVSALYLVIFDAAGEDMDDQRLMDQYYRYIHGAKGIIFILDPTQFEGVRSRLPDAVLKDLPRIEQRPEHILNRVIRIYEENDHLRPGSSIDKPVAFGLSKSDMLSFVHPTSKIWQDGCHETGFDSEDCALVSEEVSTMIEKWDNPGFVRTATRFRSSSFFAFSALGALPAKDMRIGELNSRRVLDPLLWILWRMGYMRTRTEE